MDASVIIDEDFTIDVLEEEEDEFSYVKIEPPSPPDIDCDADLGCLTQVKEELDFEDIFLYVDKYVDLEEIKTEIESIIKREKE